MADTSRLSTRASADFPIPGVKLTHLEAWLWRLVRRECASRGKCEYGAGYLAIGTGCSPSHVRGTLEKFASLGAIHIERRGRGLPHSITLVDREGGER